MRISALAVFLAADGVLVALLAYLWLAPDPGWVEPQAVTPHVTPLSLDHDKVARSASLEQFSSTLERPLFYASRRPRMPDPEPEVVQAQPADPLNNVKVFGFFELGAGKGGAILSIDGKMTRLRSGEKIGAWTLTEIDGREARLAGEGGEIRVLELGHAAQPASAPPIPRSATRPLPIAPQPPTGRVADAMAQREAYLKQVEAARKANRAAMRAKKNE